MVFLLYFLIHLAKFLSLSKNWLWSLLIDSGFCFSVCWFLVIFMVLFLWLTLYVVGRTLRWILSFLSPKTLILILSSLLECDQDLSIWWAITQYIGFQSWSLVNQKGYFPKLSNQVCLEKEIKHQRDSPTGLKEASHMLEGVHEERDHVQELRLVPRPLEQEQEDLTHTVERKWRELKRGSCSCWASLWGCSQLTLDFRLVTPLSEIPSGSSRPLTHSDCKKYMFVSLSCFICCNRNTIIDKEYVFCSAPLFLAAFFF